MSTDLESFIKLRSLSTDDPEWEQLRNRIVEENLGLAYHAVKKHGWQLLNTMTGVMRDETRNDILHEALKELVRVVAAYDPMKPNAHDPAKPYKFATFALANLVPKVKGYCKKIALEQSHYVMLPSPDAEDEDPLDSMAAELSSEARKIMVRERREDYEGKIPDKALAARLDDILKRLAAGDSATLFDRRLLFRLIADSSIVLSLRKASADPQLEMSGNDEPFPLRRRSWWQQMMSVS